LRGRGPHSIRFPCYPRVTFRAAIEGPAAWDGCQTGRVAADCKAVAWVFTIGFLEATASSAPSKQGRPRCSDLWALAFCVLHTLRVGVREADVAMVMQPPCQTNRKCLHDMQRP